MARIAGVDLPRDKRIEIGLTYIYGIGRKTQASTLTQESETSQRTIFLSFVSISIITAALRVTSDETLLSILRDLSKSVATAAFVTARVFQ